MSKKNIKPRAKLYITTSFSNVFVTSKRSDRVIFSITGGSCKETTKNNKRFKISPGTLSNMAKKIHWKLQENSIKDSDILRKVSLNYIIKIFISSLCSYNITIHNIKMMIPFTHNGVRGRKLRRK